ncbi:ABC transporter ATP-binding protein [Longimycelium tulufanense]|uniref:ABC transporter ATP-binding protein n=1 Tax=Longimycelium tulufanense TaxID=907463 RepID=A0A8J3FTK6_9PSEU|nr:ATP-binding cassette domain-containing protein [Longimycelium tulufanense]GGM41014.1 ABC transporter ATP-binding protein [Longimycelium tulufanense]
MPIPMSPVLRAHGLRKSFQGAVALDGVSLTVKPGEAVAVCGPAGAGKSTLLRCLAGDLRPDRGRVLLADGRPVDGLDVVTRRRLRVVLRHDEIDPRRTGADNVALPLVRGGVRPDTARQAALALLGALGLSGLSGRWTWQLSEAEAQAVAIARALVVNPSVVFADEPTATMAPAAGHAVTELLVRATTRAGAALVLATRDAQAARWCRRIVDLHKGRIIEPTLPSFAALAG